MKQSLVFLATTREESCAVRIDKYLQGYATVQFMESGRVSLGLDGDEQVLEGAWFWPAHPGPRVRFGPAAPGEAWFHRHVGFRGALVEAWMAEGLWPRAAQPAPPSRSPREWGALFDELIVLSRRGDAWGRRMAQNQLENLLLELAQARQAPSLAPSEGGDAWLREVLGRLEGEGAAWPDYELLAREVGVSAGTLRRRFKAATGSPIHAFVVRERVARARTLLAETDRPLKDIASSLGYANVYFFARQFRQVAGVAPGVFRKSRL